MQFVLLIYQGSTPLPNTDAWSSLPEEEQRAFLRSHDDLYEHSHGAVRVRIAGGETQIRSLAVPGYASAVLPDWNSMRRTQ